MVPFTCIWRFLRGKYNKKNPKQAWFTFCFKTLLHWLWILLLILRFISLNTWNRICVWMKNQCVAVSALAHTYILRMTSYYWPDAQGYLRYEWNFNSHIVHCVSLGRSLIRLLNQYVKPGRRHNAIPCTFLVMNFAFFYKNNQQLQSCMQ